MPLKILQAIVAAIPLVNRLIKVVKSPTKVPVPPPDVVMLREHLRKQRAKNEPSA
jgi:hypothetical protein